MGKKQAPDKDWRLVFKDGGINYKGLHVDVVAGELERIIDRDRVLKPSVIVDEARPDDAPLHHVFEWDDHKAAEEHRRQQARELVRVVKVQYTQREEITIYPKYVNVPNADGVAPGYYPAEDVVKRPDMYQSALHSAGRQLAGLEETFNQLKSLAADRNDERGQQHILLAISAMEAAKQAISVLH